MPEEIRTLRLNLQAALRYTEMAREKSAALGVDAAAIAAELLTVADQLRAVLDAVERSRSEGR